jgi:hypothetical protein
MTYAIVSDASKVVENIIVWDGVSPWTPPPGTTAVNVDGIPCDIGWIQQPDGGFAPPDDQ